MIGKLTVRLDGLFFFLEMALSLEQLTKQWELMSSRSRDDENSLALKWIR